MSLSAIRELFPNPTADQRMLIGRTCLALTPEELDDIQGNNRAREAFVNSLAVNAIFKLGASLAFIVAGGFVGWYALKGLGFISIFIFTHCGGVITPSILQIQAEAKIMGCLFGLLVSTVALDADEQSLDRFLDGALGFIYDRCFAQSRDKVVRERCIPTLAELTLDDPELSLSSYNQDLFSRMCTIYNDRVSLQFMIANSSPKRARELAEENHIDEEQLEDLKAFYGRTENERITIAQQMFHSVNNKFLEAKILAAAKSPEFLDVPGLA